MARSSKQKAKGFNKFLDFIGLVDSERDDEFDPEFDQPRSSNRGRSNRNSSFDDEFAEEPRMTRASSARRDRAASASQSSHGASRYETDDEWQTQSARPDYSSARAQRSSSRNSSRYGSEQRFGAASQSRASGRFTEAQPEDDSYRAGYSSQRQSASSYAASYGSSRSASARWNEGESSYTQTPDNSYQRHQTIIIHLQSVEGCKEVILSLIEKKTVLLNLDELDSLQTQRALDTMSGATYAIGARLSRASDRTWLITPSNVEVASAQSEESGYSGGRYM